MKFLFVLFALTLPISSAFAVNSKCESRAIAEYKKRAVEAEMQSISGKTSQLEVASERSRLQEALSSKREHCVKVARNSTKRIKL